MYLYFVGRGTAKTAKNALRVPEGFVAQIGAQAHFPFPRTDLAYDLSNRYAKSCVLVEDGYADLDFCDLPVEVPCHEALPQ